MKSYRHKISLILLVITMFSLSFAFCEPDTDCRMHVTDTPGIDVTDVITTNFGHSIISLRSISSGTWNPMGWYSIPMVYEQRWEVKFRFYFEDPIVNVSEVRFWIPSTNGTEWNNSLNIYSADPFWAVYFVC